MLVYSYDIPLVLASIVISMMAAFTGLALTRGLSTMAEGTRQARVAMAAVALGGGIWSMHFVAMLAMRFPVPVYYRALETVASVLIAILLAGLALLMMHYGRRTRVKTAGAGTVLGLGIVTMHYVGLSAIEGCVPVYSAAGVIVAGLLAIGLGIAAVGIAYARRTVTDILAATALFGASVVVVHFTAMYWTAFAATAQSGIQPALDNDELALVVLLSAFVICGAFLLSGARFLSVEPAPTAGAEDAGALPDPVTPRETAVMPEQPDPRLPYERDGATWFVSARAVAALRAEGHYTIAYTPEGRVFCPWSISEAEKRLPADLFVRVHRSYLVNADHVSGFERRKDTGACLFAGNTHLDKVPVSRARIPALRERLGL